MRNKEQLNRMETGAISQGQSALGISVGATAVLHVLAAPLDRRLAFLVSRHSIPCSLVACSAVHSLYLHPSRFIIPPSTP